MITFFSIYFILMATAGLTGAFPRAMWRRQTSVDVCADVDANLIIPVPGEADFVGGNVDVCLCLSAIPALLSVNSVVSTAVSATSVNAVTAALTALVNSNPSAQQCTYPPHSQPLCTSVDPCGFTCIDGYTSSSDGKSCVCQGESIECNGVCQLQACSSATRKKRSLSREVQARSWCAKGMTACGIPGSFKTGTFECLNVKSDLESCGGCLVPLYEKQSIGRDCTLIDGVQAVSCIDGACAVEACQTGYEVAADHTTCVVLT